MGGAHRLLGDRRGAVGVTAAAALALLALVAAMAIDLGGLALHARRLQGAADLAALAAASHLDAATAAAQATAQSNVARGPLSVETTTGRYTPDRAVAPENRFSPGGGEPNAARVTLAAPAPLFFSKWLMGRDRVVVTRNATAAISGSPKAMFSLGSRLARLDGGVANQLLSGLTGSKVSLSLMDYRTLADLDVNLLSFTDALATRLGVTAGDYDALLGTTVDAGTALGVLDALAGGVDGGALGKLTGAAAGVKVPLGRLIGVDAQAPDGLRAGLNAEVSALDLITAMLEVGAGDRQMALKLDAPLGVADLKTWLAIGERPNRSPWLTVTGTGAPIIRTAQTRLYIRLRTSAKLAGLAQVELPILVELAASEARLNALSCRPGETVEVGVRPGLARAMVGSVDESRLGDFKRSLTPQPATILSLLGLIVLDAKADIEAADTRFKALRFDRAEIEAGTIKTVASRQLADSLIASLLQRLELTPRVLNLPLDLGGLTRALGGLLAPIGPALDALLNPVFDLLGLRFGEADVQVHGLSCPDQGRGLPRLVG